MAIPFQCPCGRALIADDAHRGLEVRCPACGRRLLVPAAAGSVAQEAAPAALLAPAAPAGACPHCGSAALPMAGKCPACGAFVEAATGAAPLPPTFKICPKCGAQIPAGATTCRACGAFLDAEPPGERPGLPWEHRDESGLWTAALQTIKQVLLEPSAAFSRMTLGNPLGAAFIFFVIFGCGGAVIGAIWNAAFQSVMMSFISKFAPPGTAGQPPLPFSPGMFGALQGIVGVFLAPFQEAFLLVLLSALSHLGLMVTGAKRRDFAVTMAVFAYALGAAGVIQALPFCGGIIALVWMLVVAIIGLIHAHGAETGKAVLAALWPIVLCCCCGGAAAFAIPAMIAAR